MAAEDKSADPSNPTVPSHPRTIEDLNLKGAAAENPPFTDTLLGADSAFRRGLFAHGLLFRLGVNGAYIQNTLAAPVPANAQTYSGQRPFGEYSLNPVLTADLRQLGLQKAQLTINGQIQQASWNPAQPWAATLESIYFYKEFGQDRVEMKLGYITTDFQFIGLQVGGQVTSGAQGVYAVLPYEVGISYSPLGRARSHAQISLEFRRLSQGRDATRRRARLRGGSPTSRSLRPALSSTRRQAGHRLRAGLKHPAAGGRLSEWLRAGYISNNTPYTSLAPGRNRPAITAPTCLPTTN